MPGTAGLGVFEAELEVDRDGDCVIVTDGESVVTTTLASEAANVWWDSDVENVVLDVARAATAVTALLIGFH